MMTGLNPTTFQRLQLGAGVFLTDLDPDSVTTAAQLRTLISQRIQSRQGVLGATRGGGTFTCKPTIRHIEADGLRGHVKGATVNDGWTVKLTGTMLEITPQNVALALGGSENTSGSITTVTADLAVKHVPRLTWVGETANGLMLIELTEAVSLAGAAFTFTDKGEGTLPFEFLAHAADPTATAAPCRVMFFA